MVLNELPKSPRPPHTALPPTAPTTTTRRLALGAIAGPVLFTVAWLVLGLIQPGYTVLGTRIWPYSPIAQPISGLGLGKTAPYMNTAFILSGVLLLAGVIGVIGSLPAGGRLSTRRISAALLALPGLGFILVGLFDLDHPAIHLFGGTLLLATPVITFLVFGGHLRGVPGWRRLGTSLMVASPVTLLLYVLYALSFDQHAVALNHGVAGLAQRVLFVEILFWFVAVAHHARRQT